MPSVGRARARPCRRAAPQRLERGGTPRARGVQREASNRLEAGATACSSQLGAAMESDKPFDAPAPGDVIGGKYRVDAEIGRGGMSVVYRATHVELNQEVAIKVLSPAALAVREYVTRLRREARAASRLESEHVVRIFDIGELPGGVPYLVMECLSGSDLAVALARRGPFSIEHACACIMQACDALAEAHALGIVHRDLKPANLFLADGPHGRPWIKVLDFGISRTTGDALGPLTDPGTVLGTPAYMAPEQMEGSESLDGRADVWALGTILYELLVGQPRCRNESLPKVFMTVIRTPPPKPSRHRKEVPHALDAIVARCLAVDPRRRYASVGELAHALAPFVPNGRAVAQRIERVLERHGATAVVPPRRAPSTTSFALPAVLAVALGVAIGFAALSRAPRAVAEPRDRARISSPGRHDAGIRPTAPGAVPVTIAAPMPP